MKCAVCCCRKRFECPRNLFSLFFTFTKGFFKWKTQRRLKKFYADVRKNFSQSMRSTNVAGRKRKADDGATPEKKTGREARMGGTVPAFVGKPFGTRTPKRGRQQQLGSGGGQCRTRQPDFSFSFAPWGALRIYISYPLWVHTQKVLVKIVYIVLVSMRTFTYMSKYADIHKKSQTTELNVYNLKKTSSKNIIFCGCQKKVKISA